MRTQKINPIWASLLMVTNIIACGQQANVSKIAKEHSESSTTSIATFTQTEADRDEFNAFEESVTEIVTEATSKLDAKRFLTIYSLKEMILQHNKEFQNTSCYNLT